MRALTRAAAFRIVLWRALFIGSCSACALVWQPVVGPLAICMSSRRCRCCAVDGYVQGAHLARSRRYCVGSWSLVPFGRTMGAMEGRTKTCYHGRTHSAPMVASLRSPFRRSPVPVVRGAECAPSGHGRQCIDRPDPEKVGSRNAGDRMVESASEGQDVS